MHGLWLQTSWVPFSGRNGHKLIRPSSQGSWISVGHSQLKRPQAIFYASFGHIPCDGMQSFSCIGSLQGVPGWIFSALKDPWQLP